MDSELNKAIALGITRSVSLVVGGACVAYAVIRLNSNPQLIALGGALVMYGTGGSITDKFTVAAKVQNALMTPPPAPFIPSPPDGTP
jgi:hypothetical protein